MNYHQIKQAVETLATLQDKLEKVSIPVFSIKLNQATRLYPEDYTIGVMAGIIGKMAAADKLFMPRSEIKDLYKRLYTRNSKFAQVFSEELGMIETSPSAKIVPSQEEEPLTLQQATADIVDPVLVNALSAAWGEKIKPYTDSAANSAKIICARELKGFGLNQPAIDVLDGNVDMILCVATFDTPKGQTNVFVPVEIMNRKALLPTVFLGNTGAEDFTKHNVIKYLLGHAGEKLTNTSTEIMKVLASIKQNDQEISDVDLAVIKLRATTENPAEFLGHNQIYQTVDNDIKTDVEVQKVEDPEITSFAKSFTSHNGVAKFTHGERAVVVSRNIIARELVAAGIKNYQLSVVDCDDDGITYAVSVDNCASCKVPFKVKNGQVMMPSVIIVNGSVKEFSVEGLRQLVNDKAMDYKTAASASPLYDFQPSELIATVRTAMTENNFAKAEDALNVLLQSGNEQAYQSALSAYMTGLNDNGATMPVKSACKMIVRHAHSQHEICGHTGLPLHKVCQDQNGNCQPLYRQRISEAGEGAAYTMNHKIFF